MLKLEIKMDEEKILAERKYRVESIYQALEQAFSRYKLNQTQKLTERFALRAMEIRRIMERLEALLRP